MWADTRERARRCLATSLAPFSEESQNDSGLPPKKRTLGGERLVDLVGYSEPSCSTLITDFMRALSRTTKNEELDERLDSEVPG